MAIASSSNIIVSIIESSWLIVSSLSLPALGLSLAKLYQQNFDFSKFLDWIDEAAFTLVFGSVSAGALLALAGISFNVPLILKFSGLFVLISLFYLF